MGKGRKKRSPKSGNSSFQPAPSPEVGVPASDASHGPLQQEQVKSTAPILSTNTVNVRAAPFAESKNKASLDGDSSSFQRSKNSSSTPCHFFQRGYCRYGEFCCFQHLGASVSAEPSNSATKAPPNMRSKAPSKKSCAPEECLDWHLTGSCPRYRTCRYAHPINFDVEGSHKSGMRMDSRMGPGGFEYMASQLLRHGLGGSRGGGDEQRMRNGGFTDDDVYELSLQGIKPWDPEAWDALAVLNGWDLDGGYDYDDYDDDDYDEFGRRMSNFGF